MSDEVSRFSNGTSSPDIRALLAASFDDERESTSAMLARAMLFAQDADRKLAEAKNVKAEAERYRSDTQKNTVAQTEALVRQMHEEADRYRDEAEELREEAETNWEAARAELERAAAARTEAEEARSKAEAEAEAHRQQIIAEAERDAITIRDSARTQVNAELAARQEQVDDEIRRAMSAIEKMQAAVQAELDAQQMYTEALRFRVSAPTYEDEPAETRPEPRRERLEREVAAPTPRRRPVRKPRA